MGYSITYNSGTTTPFGTYKQGTITMGLKPDEYTVSSGFTWYANAETPNDNYLIISDTYSQGWSTQAEAKPTIWRSETGTTESFVSLVNQLPDVNGVTGFTNGGDAMGYLQSTEKYFVCKNNYLGIVTDGLVLNLDAGWYPSYSGSGITWYDLNNSNNGTLINSPTFTGNSFTDFLTNEYIDINTADVYNYIPTGTADRTIICTFKTPSSFSVPYYHMFHYGTATSNQAYGLAIITTTNGFASFPALANHTWKGSSYSNYELSTSTVYTGAVRFKNTNSPKNNFFINGEFPTTLFGQGKSSDYSINTGTTFKPRVGTRISSYLEPFGDGEIYHLLVYNRYLSDSEILQNYNATKGRFGL